MATEQKNGATQGCCNDTHMQEHSPPVSHPTILTILQVAITLDYRYQPPAGVPIDAGKLVADNGEIDGYRY